MTASITLSSPVLAADGRTLTATIAGGTGSGYAISNATGLAPHLTTGNAENFLVSSVSVSGTTLTMNLGSTVGSGEALRLDITTAATLTDSGANTPTGQTNIVATNNSAVTVTTIGPTTSPGSFELAGSYTNSGGYIRSTAAWIGAPRDNWPVECVIDATEVAILSHSSATSTVRVDTASSDATLSQNSGWAIKPVGSGLAAGKHLLRINTDFFGGVRLVGGARTVTTVAATKRTLLANTAAYLGVPQATQVAIWGAYKDNADGTVSSGASYVGLEVDCQIGGSGLEILSVASVGSNWAASVDGAAAGALIAAGDSNMNNQNQYVVLAAGLAAGTHTINATFVATGTTTSHRAVRVINGTKLTSSASIGATTLVVADTSTLAVGDWIRVDRYSNREWLQITGISGTTVTVGTALTIAHASGAAVTSYMAAAGTISAWTRKNLSAKRVAAMGDSNTEGANEYGLGGPGNVPAAGSADGSGTNYTSYDPRQSAVFLAADPLNTEVANLGVQGQTSTAMAARTGDFSLYARGAFDYATIWTGTNDIQTTATTAATFQTNVEALVTAALPLLRSGGKVILMPPGTPAGTTNAGGLNLSTALSALQAVAANHPGGSVIVPTDLLTGFVAGDYNSTLHYMTSGRQKIAANLSPYIGDGGGGGTPAAVLTGMFAAA